MKKIWCNTLMLLFVVMVIAGINMSCSSAKESTKQIMSIDKPIYVSGAQMMSDAKLYSKYKQVNLSYHGEFYSLEDINQICNTLLITRNELERVRFIKSETEAQILFDSDTFNSRWEVVGPKELEYMSRGRYKPALIFGDGSDFEYEPFNEIFISDGKQATNINSFDKGYEEYVKFELRDKENYKFLGFYLVPMEIVMEDERFESIQETLKER